MTAGGFGFEFYGFATYNALINSADLAAKARLETMVATDDHFFYSLPSDRRVTALLTTSTSCATGWSFIRPEPDTGFRSSAYG